MNLPRLSIRRHVLAYMVNALLVLFGFIAYERIGVDRFPMIDYPVVSVSTTLPGANPDVVDASITNIVEGAVNSIPGIDFIQSTSSAGVSQVAVTFNLSKDIDVAFNEVQVKVNQILRQLPDDADPPVVAKVEIGAQPIMWLSLRGDRTLQQLNQYARNVIKKRLETIDGVGDIRLGGERPRTIRVNLDLDRMAGLQVTAQDVRAAFGREHIQLPGGYLTGERTESQIKLDLEFHSPEELADMIVRYTEGAPVRLRDIAVVEDALADYRQLARFKGQPAVGMGIVRISNANTVAIVEEVQRVLKEEIVPELPPGLTIEIAGNDARLITEIVAALQEHLVVGTILAGLVVWFFLRSFRSTVIVATAIPVSLMGAVAVMYFMGYTFNTVTLLALLLLIGVVVDDAIVVLENIYRHRETLDPDPISAAINGSDQVVFAVTAASLTLISIFASVLFLGGIIGRFFESFAVVVTFGVAVSLFVSLTLTPMLCSRHLEVAEKHGPMHRRISAWLDAMDRSYRRILDWGLAHRWRVVVIAGAVVVITGTVFLTLIGKEFVPEEDEGRFVINFRAPLGTSIDATFESLQEIERILASKPEVATYFAAIGLGGAGGRPNAGISFVQMVPRSQRNVRQQEFLAQLRRELAAVPGVLAFAAAPPAVGGGGRGEPLQFAVVGPDLDEVARLSQALHARLQRIPQLGRVDLDLQLDLPQVRVNIDRTRAADLGLSSQDVAFAVTALAGGLDVAKYNDVPGDGERYDIRIKAADGQLRSPQDLHRIFLRAQDGSMVRLDTIARIEELIGPAVISRYNLQYAASFYATPEVPMAEAVNRVFRQADEILPIGYRVVLQGEARELGDTAGYVIFALVLALTLVYMVLASQFDSFIQPFIVMLAQPLAIVGGLFGLWVTGHTLNIYSMIGLVLLIGLVAKNSILLVDLTNQLREQGRAIDEALREACPIRMRPVLMTSLTVILALLPAALGIGAGSDSNGPLAVAVIGGMISSTLLTLVVVPAVYSLVEGRRERRAKK
jgi:HAE1 family hydrophobic/amphiphilic exporter-1